MRPQATVPATLGGGLHYSLMPGYWLLARMGKRVLRPGGIELTRQMLDALDIGASDDVVEFAPGFGVTARATLDRGPRSYVGIERDEDAAKHVRGYLSGKNQQCLVGRAEETGLPDRSASVVYGEALLTMQTAEQRASIVAEAARVLRAGGRYGIHELALDPDGLAEATKSEIQHALSDAILSGAIHLGARTLTASEWRELLAAQGFDVKTQIGAPMHLLEPKRLIRDEGLLRALRFVWNVAKTPAARKRIRAMRAIFRRYAKHLVATAIVAVRS
ncbi:MAG: methyltransferase domain-containing protein [Candidatus Aminicenantes bacterium]|nr:methyltransferase domain-containing protein [Candidatus Aminicenantes bacterium]